MIIYIYILIAINLYIYIYFMVPLFNHLFWCCNLKYYLYDGNFSDMFLCSFISRKWFPKKWKRSDDSIDLLNIVYKVWKKKIQLTSSFSRLSNYPIPSGYLLVPTEPFTLKSESSTRLPIPYPQIVFLRIRMKTCIYTENKMIKIKENEEAFIRLGEYQSSTIIDCCANLTMR